MDDDYKICFEFEHICVYANFSPVLTLFGSRQPAVLLTGQNFH